ncbi:MAG: histidine kinase [Bacteroidota bacterium]
MKQAVLIFFFLYFVLIAYSQVPSSLHFELVETENQPNLEYVTQFNSDAYGNLWISSLRGLFKFDGYKSDLYVHDPNDSLSLVNNRVFSTFLSDNGDLWICAARGVQKYNSEKDVFELRMKNYIRTRKDVYDLSFNCALDLDSDRLLIGYKRGLLIYNKLTDEVEKIDTLDVSSKRDGYSSSTHVLEMVEDNVDEDVIWLLTRMGIFKYYKSVQRADLISNDLGIEFINNKDRGHTLSVIGNELLLVSNYFQVFTYNKSSSRWRTISNGINEKDKKYIRNAISVVDDYVLIVYMDQGIDFYLPNSKRLKPMPTYFEEGLERDVFSSGMIDDNGYLTFINGNAKYMKTKAPLVPFHRKPALSINDLIVNGFKLSKADYSVDQMKLKNYERNLEFKLGLTYPDLNVPIKYYYTLDKNRQSWVELGKDRKIELFKLESGNHTIYGKVVYGNEQIEGEILSLTVARHFYETWWFRALFILVFGSVVFLFYWQYKSRKMDKQAFNTALLGLQMNSLRSQMNPHFLFNSLNSVKNYMVNRGADEAADYLTKFSLLIRKILENSRKKLLTLEEEVEMLDLYIEMEKKRFSEKFSYKLEVDQSIDQTHFYLAPMIIQPYIENAIWHGLMNKESDRNLSVRFLPDGENVICYIVDNGIGRVEARKRSRNQNSSKKSLGMEITGDHLSVINKLYQINAAVDIEDCYDQKGNPTGTKVKIFLPLLHKN